MIIGELNHGWLWLAHCMQEREYRNLMTGKNPILQQLGNIVPTNARVSTPDQHQH